jgi:hypothetical protein
MAAATDATDKSLDLVISILRLTDPFLGLPDSQTWIRGPLFRNSSANFRARNHDHASNAERDAFGQARESPDPDPDDHQRSDDY